MSCRKSWIAIGLVLLAGCSKNDPAKDFPPSDPLHYVQVRPVAPYTGTVGSTGSMAPSLVAGDLVAVIPASIHDVRSGELVAFWWSARQIPVVHRVVRVFTAGNGEIELVTKGDANSFEDDFVTTQQDLIGLVTILNHKTN